MPSARRAFRLVLVCLALNAAGPTAPLLVLAGGVLGVSAPAGAQSGGYSRPGAGVPPGGYGGLNRRPALSGSGGYRQSSGSSFGGLGSFGGDRAISRGAASQALQDYRAPHPPPAPAAGSRRPSTGWGASAWPTEPLQRRAPVMAPGLGGSAPRFGAWDAVLAWALLNSLGRPGNAAYFQDNR